MCKHYLGIDIATFAFFVHLVFLVVNPNLCHPKIPNHFKGFSNALLSVAISAFFVSSPKQDF